MLHCDVERFRFELLHRKLCHVNVNLVIKQAKGGFHWRKVPFPTIHMLSLSACFRKYSIGFRLRMPVIGDLLRGLLSSRSNCMTRWQTVAEKMSKQHSSDALLLRWDQVAIGQWKSSPCTLLARCWCMLTTEARFACCWIHRFLLIFLYSLYNRAVNAPELLTIGWWGVWGWGWGWGRNKYSSLPPVVHENARPTSSPKSSSWSKQKVYMKPNVSRREARIWWDDGPTGKAKQE